MCKLAGWTSTKSSPLAKSSAGLALEAAHDIISKTERHGFGYAQHGAKGYRAKYLSPSDFKDIDALPNIYKRGGKAAAAFKVSHSTSIEGAYKPSDAMIVHGRTATCDINIGNVHPFRRKGWTMAHNGVIDWAGEKSEDHDKVTCDSQHILIALADHKSTEARKEALSNITGYAAFLASSPQGHLTVAVDDKATLYAGITSKGRWIFGTTAAIVEAIAEAWNSPSVTAYELDDWTYLEFDPTGGDPELSTWKHRSATQRQLGFAQQSIGRSYYDNRHTPTHYKWAGGYSQDDLLTRDEVIAGELTEAEATSIAERRQQELDEREWNDYNGIIPSTSDCQLWEAP